MAIKIFILIFIFILVICICLLLVRFATKDHTPPESELKVFKTFVEKMMREGRVIDENNNPIRNIEVIDKLSGSFNLSNLKADLNMLYNKPECIIRLVDDKMTFEIRQSKI